MKKLLDRAERYGISFNRLNYKVSNSLWKDIFVDDINSIIHKAGDDEHIYGIELLSVNLAIDKNKWSREFPHMIVAGRSDLKVHERLFPTYDKARRYFHRLDFSSLAASNPEDLDIFMVTSIAEYKNKEDKKYPFFIL